MSAPAVEVTSSGIKILTHEYTPRGTALELFNRRDSEVLLSGPAGTGKTRAALEKLHAMMLLNPGAKGLIVRKTLASLGSTALETWRKFVVVEGMQAGVLDYFGGSSEEPPQYRYANGSRVIIGGMDKATKIMSSEYDVIYVQEAIELTLDDWEALTTRLRNGVISFNQLIADANPAQPTHWLKRRCDEGSCIMLHSRHEDNPVYFNDDKTLTDKGKDYIRGILDKLTGVRKLRLRDGIWAAAEGVIYEEFTQDHMHKPVAHPPDSWPRLWGVDFGFRHPFVLQKWAVNPDGMLLLYAEIYHTETLVEDHARAALASMRKSNGTLEPKPKAIICDHDAEDRATLERHLGMRTVAADKRVSPGIQAVQARLRFGKNGKPGLMICHNAVLKKDTQQDEKKKPTCTAEEFPGYVWDGKGKEVPVKEDDDGMDALRYVVTFQDIKDKVRPPRWL